MGDTSVQPLVSSKGIIKLNLSMEISLILDLQNISTIDHAIKSLIWKKSEMFMVDTYSMSGPLNFNKIL